MNLSCTPKRQFPGYRFDTADYDHFQAILVTSGEVTMTVRGAAAPVRGGGVCLLPVGSVFSLHCGRQGYRGVAVNRLDEFSPEHRGEAAAFLAGPELRTTAGLIEEEFRRPGWRFEDHLLHLGRVFEDQVLRLARRKAGRELATATPEYWAARARAILDRSVYANQSAEEALACSGLGYRQLSRHFRSVLRQTPKQYQLWRRLQEARRLLATTKLALTSIALELGFASSQHFATQFAAREGMPPTEFRRRAVRR